MARMKAKTAVERCREKYPSMTQAVYSMARNPEKYGIRFTPEARQLAGYPSTPGQGTPCETAPADFPGVRPCVCCPAGDLW